jgi:hypothetical protein
MIFPKINNIKSLRNGICTDKTMHVLTSVFEDITYFIQNYISVFQVNFKTLEKLFPTTHQPVQ